MAARGRHADSLHGGEAPLGPLTTMHPPQTLDRIARGRRVRVLGVRGEDAIARRLDDLGLRPGVEIEVLRSAPLGDPTVFELHGYQLCLRASESQRVEVRPVADGGSPA
jgi:Fe2+ transport system protein FeoA